MKRNAQNDDKDELISMPLVGTRLITDEKLSSSPRKKLKFGVDAILGNADTHSDNDSSFETGNDSDDELRHNGNIFEFIIIKRKIAIL
jgi:hypothetical protein